MGKTRATSKSRSPLFYASTEVLLWATKAKQGSKDRYTFNYEVLKQVNGDKQMKNVWRFEDPGFEGIVSNEEVSSMWKMKPPSSGEKKHGKHPTQKPAALVARSLQARTNVGDLVVDPVHRLGHNRRYRFCNRAEIFLAANVKKILVLSDKKIVEAR